MVVQEFKEFVLASIDKKIIPVTIFDRQDPLSVEYKPASYVDTFHLTPFCNLIVQIFYMMFQKCLLVHGPLALKWNYIPKMFNWFLNYFKIAIKSMMHTAKYGKILIFK